MHPQNSAFMRALIVAVSLLVTTLAGCGGGSAGATGNSGDSDHDGVANASDCAPNNAAAWHNMSFVSRDDDADGFRVNVGGQVCAGAALPANRFATEAVGNDIDCNDADAQKSHLIPYASRDEDQDGYRVNVIGNYCGNLTLPANYFTTEATTRQLDCDDAAASKWLWSTIYRDADGDGVGAGAMVSACVGNTAGTGFAFTGYDPLDDPNDPASASVSNLELAVYLLVTP